MSEKQLNMRFRLLQALLILIECAGISYISPILVSLGYNVGSIGKIAAAAALAAAAARPFWGMINDRYSCAKQVLLAGTAAGIVFYNLLTNSRGLPALTVLCVCGLQVTIVCMMNFADAWAMCLIRHGYALNYGSTRVGGSVSYAFGSIILGMLCARYGYAPSNVILWFLWGMLLLIALRIPNPPKLDQAEQISLKEGAREVLSNRIYCVMLLALFISTLMTSAMENFYSVRILSLGGTEREVGIALFIQAMSEVPVMLNYNNIRKKTGLQAAALMGIAFLMYGVKAMIIGSAQSLTLVILASMLQAGCYAIFVPASVEFMLGAVKQEYLSTAHMLFLAIGHGVAAVIGDLVWGKVAQTMGIHLMFQRCALLAIVAATLAFVAAGMQKKKELSKE